MEIKRATQVPMIDSPMNMRKLQTKTPSISGELVMCNIDLVTQIFMFLPASSVIRFKSVCKRWNSLISGRSFCLLWQQHQAPRLLFKAMYYREDSHCCISLFGSDIGAIQFRLSHDTVKDVLQSCNGFLLLKGLDDYWIYNPTTLEHFTLPPFKMRSWTTRTRYRARCPLAGSNLKSKVRILELTEGNDHEFHRSPGDHEIKSVNLAIDKSSKSNGRVVILTSNMKTYIYQIYVAEVGGDWRNSRQVFEYRDKLVDGVYWNNSIIWLGRDVTVCFDVDGEELQIGASPPGSIVESFNFVESGGHLHFIQRKDSSTLIVHEMMTDLSAWFVKYSISTSQIDPLSSYGFGYGLHDKTLHVLSLIELDKDSAVLVLRVDSDIISYRIQDKKNKKDL